MSEWKKSAADRRDARNLKEETSEPSGKSRKKKNTKKWCKGKEGVEHKPICKKYNEVKLTNLFEDWRLLVCSECGKELDHYYPIKQFSNKPKPEWVDK